MRAADGSVAPGELRVRFGEVEARGIALTPAGRDAVDPLPPEPAAWAAAIPDTERELARAGLAWFTAAVSAGAPDLAAAGRRPPDDVEALVDDGWVSLDPVVYEDFLPRSAAGIFRSNLAGDGVRRRDRGRRRAGRRVAGRRPRPRPARPDGPVRRGGRRVVGTGARRARGGDVTRRPRVAGERPARRRGAGPGRRPVGVRAAVARRARPRRVRRAAGRAWTRSARSSGGPCGTGCRWCRRARTPGWSARRCPGPVAR